MPEGRIGLITSFIVAFIFELFAPRFSGFQQCGLTSINFLIPPLIFAIYSSSEKKVLWLALFSGLTADILELTPRLGFLGISYLLTALLIYPYRLFFFKDSLSTPFIMTALFSCLNTILTTLLSHLTQTGPLLINVRFCFTELLLMPFVDAIYTLTIFLLPRYAISQYYRAKRRNHN